MSIFAQVHLIKPKLFKLIISFPMLSLIAVGGGFSSGVGIALNFLEPSQEEVQKIQEAEKQLKHLKTMNQSRQAFKEVLKQELLVKFGNALDREIGLQGSELVELKEPHLQWVEEGYLLSVLVVNKGKSRVSGHVTLNLNLIDPSESIQVIEKKISDLPFSIKRYLKKEIFIKDPEHKLLFSKLELSIIPSDSEGKPESNVVVTRDQGKNKHKI